MFISGFSRALLQTPNGCRNAPFVSNKIHSLASDFVHYDDLAMATLEEALGYLPVLGQYYAGALHMMPGMKRWMQQVIKAKEAKIDALIKGRRKGASLPLPRSGLRNAMYAVRSESGHSTTRNRVAIGMG